MKKILLVSLLGLCSVAGHGKGLEVYPSSVESSPYTFVQSPESVLLYNLRREIGEARQNLPMETGFGLMLTSLNFVENTKTVVYRYKYTVPFEKPSPENIKDRKTVSVNLIKSNPDSKEYQLFLKSATNSHAD